MGKVKFWVGVLPFFLMGTLCSISLLKWILFDFLIGSTNRRKAEKIKHEATPWQKFVSMSYIRPHLVQDIKAFERYHKFYIIYLCSLIPQTILLFIFALVFASRTTEKVALAISLLNCILGILIGIPIKANHTTKYAYRHRKMNGKK